MNVTFLEYLFSIFFIKWFYMTYPSGWDTNQIKGKTWDKISIN